MQNNDMQIDVKKLVSANISVVLSIANRLVHVKSLLVRVSFRASRLLTKGNLELKKPCIGFLYLMLSIHFLILLASCGSLMELSKNIHPN